MADTLPQDPETLNALVQALVEGRANPRFAHRAQVGAGGYGLPYMPPMPSEDGPSGNEFPLSDLVAEKTGSPLAGTLIDKTAKLGRVTGNVVSHGITIPSMLAFAVADQAGEIGKKLADWSFSGSQAQAAGRSPEDIAKEQEQLRDAGYYHEKIDGVDGTETKKARQKFQADEPKRRQLEFDRKNQELEAARLRAQQGGNEAEIARANAALAAAKTEQDRIAAAAEAERVKNEQREAGNKRMQDMEKNAGWFSKAVRDYSVPAGVTLGALVGALTRYGAVKGSDFFSRQRATAGDETMRNALAHTPEVTAADLNQRVGAVNDFFRKGQRSPFMGGAPEVPYRVTPNAAPGVSANPNTPPAAGLYQPNKVMNAAVDAAIPAAFGAESALAQALMVDPSRAELKAAQDAAALDPSEVNLIRLRKAMDNEAIAKGFMNFGRLGALGYGATALKSQRNPASPSATGTAEAEQLAINDYLRRYQQPPPPPTPHWARQNREQGRFSGGFVND